MLSDGLPAPLAAIACTATAISSSAISSSTISSAPAATSPLRRLLATTARTTISTRPSATYAAVAPATIAAARSAFAATIFATADAATSSISTAATYLPPGLAVPDATTACATSTLGPALSGRAVVLCDGLRVQPVRHGRPRAHGGAICRRVPCPVRWYTWVRCVHMVERRRVSHRIGRRSPCRHLVGQYDCWGSFMRAAVAAAVSAAASAYDGD